MKGKSSRRALISLGIAIVIFGSLYFTTGLFIVQPMGAIPDGATVWYWRTSTNLPFISSADGLQLERIGKVSILGRAITLGVVAKTIKDKKIATLPYSKTLYLISTDGKEFDR